MKGSIMSRAGFWHKFHDSILTHKLSIWIHLQFDLIRFNSISIILDIFQVQYMTNFLKEKNLSTNAVKYKWESVGTLLYYWFIYKHLNYT